MFRIVHLLDSAPLSRRLAPVVLGTAMVLAAACSDDGDDGPSGPDPNEDVIYEWSFGTTELNGWEVGFASVGSWGTVTHVGADHDDSPSPDEEGSAKLDGVGDPGVPNAWIVRAGVPLPDDAVTLAYFARNSIEEWDLARGTNLWSTRMPVDTRFGRRSPDNRWILVSGTGGVGGLATFAGDFTHLRAIHGCEATRTAGLGGLRRSLAAGLGLVRRIAGRVIDGIEHGVHDCFSPRWTDERLPKKENDGEVAAFQ